MRLLVQGGRVLDPLGELHRPAVQDVLVEDGRIVAVAPGIEVDAERLDAAGCLVVPGFVNAHSHSHDTLLRGLFEGLPLDEWGLTSFPAAWARRSEAEIATRTALHAAECLANGITTVMDMVSVVGPDRAHADAILDAYAASGIRAVLAVQFADRALRETVPYPALLDGLPVLGAADPAAMQGFVEALLEQGGPLVSWGLGPSAPQRCSEAMLAWASRLSAERKLRVFTHVYETRMQAVQARLAYGADGGSLVRHLARLGLLDGRLVVAHGVWMDAAEVRALGAAGAHVALNPLANLKLLNGVAPIGAYADAGAGLALGCDNSSASDGQSMLQAMKAMALFHGVRSGGVRSGGGESGGVNSGGSKSGGVEAAALAFRAATVGGARALGLEVGRVAPGFRADLALFDLDGPCWRPLNSAVRQLVYGETGQNLRHVLVEGRLVAAGPALAQAAEAARDGMAEELEAMRQRQGPMQAAMSAMRQAAESHELGFDRRRLAY